ncbi:MFS transporter [Actinomadura barringtoniae]|uniref:MFS transporter n=1 Tax=Actinomadura barringtoniae TaxID=1427535 RepID=A0A939PG79_9ACTN|nr:MFS transporter [Actinomadura barringtoniae]MBO2447931.1 MFS transporter [Actinomadura barringtoniae]
MATASARPNQPNQSVQPARSQPEPSRPARGAVLAAATLTIMAAAIIAPSLPAMKADFAGTPGADLMVRFSLTVTSLAIAVSAPVSGVVADRVGRRSLLVFGLVMYAVTGTAGFFATDLYVLLATRALLGVAVGAIMTAVSATITDWFDGPRRASFLGLQQVFASLGGVVFLPLAGLLAAVSWRAPFWIYTASALVAVLAIRALREEPRAEPAAAAARPDRSRQPSADSVTGHHTTNRTDHITSRITGLYLLALVVTLAFYMAPTQLPFLLSSHGSGPTATGAVIAGSTLSSAAGALAFPVLRRRLSPAAISTVSVALLGAGWLLAGTAGTVAQIAAGLLVGGAGVGLAVPNLNLRLSELAHPDQRGRILSGLVTGIFLGQFLSPLAVEPLIQLTGIADAFIWTGIAMAAGAALAALGTWRTRTAQTAHRQHDH